MRRTTLVTCFSAALVVGLGGCERETVVMQDSPAVAAPDTRPLDDAAPIDTTAINPAATADRSVGLSVATGPHDRYLVDGRGRAVYVLENDTDGSRCTGDCLQVWPPLPGDPRGAAGAGDEADMPAASDAAGAPDMPGTDLLPDTIDTIQRPDGTMQMTYNGHPPYHYSRDRGDGDTSGHHLEDEWGEWYLLGPDGDRLEERT